MRARLTNWLLSISPAYLIATVAVLAALWPVPFDLPVSQDHAHHYLATQIFVDDLLASGHLTGWTHRIGTGLPYGDVYGTLVYFVTGFLRIVTFGLVPLAASYSFGIVLVWLIGATAIVAWARRLGAGHLAAGFAAVAFVLDPGASREGGWVYSMFHAVWPQLVGTGLWLWGVIAMLRLAERPTFRRLAVAVLTVGLAVWAHPMNALNTAVTMPLLVLVVAVVRDRRAETPATPWLCVATVLAGVVAMGWFAHLLAAGKALESFTAYGTPLADFADNLLAGQPFENQLVLVSMLALAGWLAAAMARRTEGMLSLLLVSVFVVLASMHLLAVFDIGLSEDNRLIMYRRFVVSAKPLWYAMSGLGLTVVWRGARALTERTDDERTESPESPWWFTAVCGAFLAWCAVAGLDAQVHGPAARPLTATDAGLTDDLDELTKLLETHVDSEIGRVGFYHARGQHGDYGLFALADAGLGHLNSRGVPCHALVWDNRTASPTVMAKFGATHVVTRDDQQLSRTKLVGKAGIYRLYEIDAPVTPPLEILGAGRVELESWAPMAVRATLEGTSDDTRLVFGVAPYHKWTATQNGRVLRAERVRRYGMTLWAFQGVEDGVVELNYRDTTFEHVAFAACCLVLLLMLVCLWRGDEPLPSIRVVSGGRTSQIVVATAAVCLVGGLVALWIVGRDAARKSWGPGVIEVLHDDDPQFAYAPNPYCVRPFSRNPRAGCTEEVLDPVLVVGPRKGKRMPGCLRFGVPDSGHATLKFELPDGTTRLRGQLHALDRGLRKATIDTGKPHAVTLDHRFDLPVSGSIATLRVHNHGKTAQACLELVAARE